MSYGVLVNSCDAYSDLWPYFFALLKRNWPGIENHSIYLNTETKSYVNKELHIETINTPIMGKDMWGRRVLHSLQIIKEEILIVLMDDFFLCDMVNNDRISCFIREIAENEKIAAVYLKNPYHKNLNESKYPGLGEIRKNEIYRLNSAPAIWKKEKLRKYTMETDSPWAWEYFGTCRTNHQDDEFYCVLDQTDSIYNYAHMIYRGKWLKDEVKHIESKYDIQIDVRQRGAVSINDLENKRGFKWKMRFLFTGIRMVGVDAIKEIIKDKRNQNKQ